MKSSVGITFLLSGVSIISLEFKTFYGSIVIIIVLFGSSGESFNVRARQWVAVLATWYASISGEDSLNILAAPVKRRTELGCKNFVAKCPAKWNNNKNLKGMKSN